jgi:hypothetical protein
MLDIKTSINSLGLLLTLLGAYVVYANSPLNEYAVDGGAPDTDFNKIKLAAARKNSRMRYGVYAVLAGTLLQLVSNFVPT